MNQLTPVAARPALRRRFRVPLTAVAVPLVLFGVLWFWERSDLDPAPLFPLFMLFQLGTLLSVAVLSVWFLFFSGLSWRTKASGVALVLGLIAAASALIRKVEYTGSMRPMVVTFRWDPDPQVELERRLATNPSVAESLAAADLSIGPTDFPRYRGPAGDGVVSLGVLATNWMAQPPRVLWRQAGGGGYAGFAVAGNSAVTLEQRRDQEVIVCYDRATGRERWAHAYPAAFQHSEPLGGGGPRATPTIADGAVYSLGAMGDLVCLDGATGKLRWSINILTDNGARNVEWGMSGSPLVYGSLVVVNPGVDPDRNIGQAVAAYDRQTGKRVWATGDKPAGYSSPHLAQLAGVEQILLFDGGGLAGIDPADGRELWRFPWTTFSGMNIVQPVVLPGDRVLISSELSNGCALLEVRRSENTWSVTPVWQNRSLGAKFSNPVWHGGPIYGLSNGILVCLDGATGARLWKEGRFGHGQILRTGDVLLIVSESGELVAVAADPAGYRELGRLKVFSGKTWNTPALAGRQLFLRNHKEMACLELPGETLP